MTLFEVIILKKWLWDINGQPTVFHRSLYESWQNPPLDFFLDLFALYTAKKTNFNILRFPVNFGKRYSGVGHNDGLLAKIKYSVRTLKFSLKLRNII